MRYIYIVLLSFNTFKVHSKAFILHTELSSRKKGKWFLIGHEKVFYKNQPSNLKASLYYKKRRALHIFDFILFFRKTKKKLDTRRM